MRRSLLVGTVVALGVALAPAPALADGTYHSAHIVLSPITGTTAGSGFVENAHANGPNVYAHEQYQLRHASPGVTYQVTLHIFMADPTCQGAADLALPTAQLMTNAAGNAAGSAVFTPTDAAGLPKNVAHGIVWTMTATNGTGYTSGCETVVLD
jgi:hypothetical protein